MATTASPTTRPAPMRTEQSKGRATSNHATQSPASAIDKQTWKETQG